MTSYTYYVVTHFVPGRGNQYEVHGRVDGKATGIISTHSSRAEADAAGRAWVAGYVPAPSPTPVLTPVEQPVDPWETGSAGWETSGALQMTPRADAFELSWNVEASDSWSATGAWTTTEPSWDLGREDTWTADDGGLWGAIQEMFGFNGGADSGGLGW